MLDEVAGTEDKTVETTIVFVLPHIAGRAYALLQQPGFVIEAVGVGVAMRPLQPHGELPTLARLHVADFGHLIAITRIPRHGDAGRHLTVRAYYPLHR